MADSGPLWGLVGAFGGSIVSQLLNAALSGRRDRAAQLEAKFAKLEAKFDKLAADSRASHDALSGAIGDVRTKVAGLEAVVSAFVVGPAERQSPRKGE